MKRRKTMVEKDRMATVAERGCIYDFIESDGAVKNQVLVVSSKKRSNDRMISIIMIGDSQMGYDVVKVCYNGQRRFVHCGMVTYCSRDRLGRKICSVGNKTMDDIDFLLADQMGLNAEKSIFYKEMYENLLDRVMGGTT